MTWRNETSRILASVVLMAVLAGAEAANGQDASAGWRTVYQDGFDYPPQGLAEHWKGMTSDSWNDASTSRPFAFDDRSAWRTEKGALLGENRNGIFDNATCTVPFYGDVRVEWTVTALKDNLNFNSFLSGQNRWQGYMFHVAAFGDPLRCTLTLGTRDTELAASRLPAPLSVGKETRFMMEMDGSTVRLTIDGRTVLAYRDPYPRSSSIPVFFGFENNLNNIQRIDNVRVSVKQPVETQKTQVSRVAAATSSGGPAFTGTGGKVLIDFGEYPESTLRTNWEIRLSPFSDSPESRNNSDWRLVAVDPSALPANLQFTHCLGLRLNISDSMYEDYAGFQPRRPFSEYTTPEGRGVVRNVGLLRGIRLTVRGGNAGHGYEIRMHDQFNRYLSVRFGPLDFIGWRRLEWVNPRYNDQRRDRELSRPAPPPLTPLTLVLDSIVVYKAHFETQGFFVGYIKDITVDYDPAGPVPATNGP